MFFCKPDKGKNTDFVPHLYGNFEFEASFCVIRRCNCVYKWSGIVRCIFNFYNALFSNKPF